MLSISLPMKGVSHADYYLDDALEKYYGADEAGRWFGAGAKQLGLEGAVTRESFQNLLHGFSPAGSAPLVQNAGHSKRQKGWDLTLSAPKSVSVLMAVSPEPMSIEVKAAHRAAVEKTLAYIEETAGVTRRGKGGVRKEKAALTFATFQHETSRTLDPQIHTHCVLINVAVRADGTAGTLQSVDFFRAKLTAGAMYQVALAAELKKRLGLQIVPAKIGFQIQGVPKEVCAEFSTRRRDIERKLDALGLSGGKAAKAIAESSRPKKVKADRGELKRIWREKAHALRWTEDQAAALAQNPVVQNADARDVFRAFRHAWAALPKDEQTHGRVRGLAANAAISINADAEAARPLLDQLRKAQWGKSSLELAREQNERQRHSTRTAKDQALTQEEAVTPALAIRETWPKESPAIPEHPPAQEKPRGLPPEVARSQTATADAASGELAQDKPDLKPSQEIRKPSQRRQDGSQRLPQHEITQEHGKSADRMQSEPGPEERFSSQENKKDEANRNQSEQRKSEDSSHKHKKQTSNQRSAEHEPPRGHGFWTASKIAAFDPIKARDERTTYRLFFAYKEVIESGEIFNPIVSEPMRRRPDQAKRNEAFERAMRKQERHLGINSQTLLVLTLTAVKTAVARRADAWALFETVRNISRTAKRQLPLEKGGRIFNKVLSELKPVQPHKKWAEVRWRKGFFFFDLRVQERRLFPKAPKLNPLHKTKLPAIRIIGKTPDWLGLAKRISKRIAASRTRSNDSNRKSESKSESRGQSENQSGHSY